MKQWWRSWWWWWHGDNQMLELEKDEREKQNAWGKGINSRSHFILVIETLSEWSYLGSIVVLLRGVKLVSKCGYQSATRCSNSLNMHLGSNGVLTSLKKYLWKYANIRAQSDTLGSWHIWVRVMNFTGRVSAHRVRTVRWYHRRPVQKRPGFIECTGRWPQLDQCVRSMEAVKMLVSVFDRTLGHFVIGRWWGAFGPADMAAHRGDSVSPNTGWVQSSITERVRSPQEPYWKRSDAGGSASGHLCHSV